MIFLLKKDTSEKELVNHIELWIWTTTKFVHAKSWKPDFRPGSRLCKYKGYGEVPESFG